MNLTQWYAVSIAALAGLLLILRIGSVATTFFVARFQYTALKHIVYPLFVRRRYWRAVTRLQAALLGSYFAINGFCMGLGIRNASELISRSGMMASINLIPLFFGGRTSTLANFLGISLHTYYLAHHWIGRVVILQGLLHVGLVVASGMPWTFNSSQISGISAASALGLILLSSVYVVRRLVYEFFLKIHFLLSFVAIAALLNHVRSSGIGKSIFPLVALCLWAFNTLLRLVRLAYYNIGGARDLRWGQGRITHFFHSQPNQNIVSAMRLNIRPRRPLEIRPGQYFYLFFSDMGVRRRFQAHPYMVTWWDDSKRAMSLSFLIQPQGGVSAGLIARNSIRSVIIDGPYGKDLALEDYETVILIAKGIGIAGILPYARHMTYRRVSKEKDNEAYRRGLIIRKVDVFWVMEDNSQEHWISEWITDLQQKDSEKSLILTFSYFYPHKQLSPPPIANDTHWRFIYQKKPLSIIESLMVKQIQRSAGRTKVAVCGDPIFSTRIREVVIKNMVECQDVEFAEVEFQPDIVSQPYPGMHSLDNEDYELGLISNPCRDYRMRRLMRPEGQEGDSTRLSKSRGMLDDGKKRLIRAKSMVTTTLSTLPEEDEKADLGVQTLGGKVEGKEFV